MFGYVVVNRQEMKLKDYEMYRAWYCGLCRELRERYGLPGQLSLSYDLTFVLLLLTGLYEPRGYVGTTRCAVSPILRHTVRKNAFTEYAAEMNVLLMYYKCLDDWKDEKKIIRLAYARLLEKGRESRPTLLRKKEGKIREALHEIDQIERSGEEDLDAASGAFGRLMGEILDAREDVWSASLRSLGFYLGKFVYLMDAYEDVEKDLREGNYNPLTSRYLRSDASGFEQECKQLLTMMLASACQSFESLPILKYGDILRNILYSGVWLRFESVSKKRREE